MSLKHIWLYLEDTVRQEYDIWKWRWSTGFWWTGHQSLQPSALTMHSSYWLKLWLQIAQRKSEKRPRIPCSFNMEVLAIRSSWEYHVLVFLASAIYLLFVIQTRCTNNKYSVEARILMLSIKAQQLVSWLDAQKQKQIAYNTIIQ